MSKEWFLKIQKNLKQFSKLELFWSFFGVHIVYAYIFLGIFLLVFPKTRAVGLIIIFTVAVTKLCLVELLSWVFPKKRPYQEYNFTPIASGIFSKIEKVPNSYPSGHTASLFAVLVILFFYFPDLYFGLIPFFGLTMIGRVILGYHYFSDIVGGLAVGFFSGFLAVLLLH